MGVMDKFLNYMKLNGEEEDDYYDDDYLDDEEEPAASPRKSSASKQKNDDYEEAPARKLQPAGKITPIKQSSSRRMTNGSGMEVCVISPLPWRMRERLRKRCWQTVPWS